MKSSEYTVFVPDEEELEEALLVAPDEAWPAADDAPEAVDSAALFAAADLAAEEAGPPDGGAEPEAGEVTGVTSGTVVKVASYRAGCWDMEFA